MPEDPILDPGLRSELMPAPQPAPKKSLINKWVIGAISVSLVLIAAGSWYAFGYKKPTAEPVSNRVSLAIKGPDQLSSGNQTEYRVTYTNGEDADLTNITLELSYPQNFKFKSAEPKAANSSGTRFSLPVLKSGDSFTVVVGGALSGSTGEDKKLSAALHYRLSNFNSEFRVENSFHTAILAPDLMVEIVGPIEVTNGQDTTYTVSYNNVSGQDLDNMALELVYPDGFSFTSSNPPASKDNRLWNLGKLAVNASGKLEVTGAFTGDVEQEKTVVANLGAVINNNFAPQVTASANFRLAPSSLVLTQSTDPKDTVRLGDSVNYTLRYRNDGFVGMTNVVISVTLQGTALDLKQLKANNAIITGNTLTWKSATLRELALLAPSKSGTIAFTVPVKQAQTTNVKEQMITGTAAIYSDQISKPIRANDIQLKLSSNLSMAISGEYVSGALPMEVGKPTVFSVSFLLVNLSNDLSDVEVIASMPLPASAWKGVVTEAEKDNVSFDPNGNKIRWRAGNVAAFTGKYSPARMLTFQLEVTPGISDQNQILTLLSDVQAAGQDTFTGKPLESQKWPRVTVSDLNDDQIDAKGANVR